MNRTKLLGIIILLTALSMLLLSACSQSNDVEEALNETIAEIEENYVSDDAADDELVDEEASEDETKTTMAMLEESTGYKYLDYYYWELDNWNTIVFQRELVGNTFLLNQRYYDIFEDNGKIYLSSVNSYYDYFLIEINEEQCQELLKTGLFANGAIAFRIDAVKPIALTYAADYDYDWDEDEEVIIEDSISASIYNDNGYRIIYGTCIDVYGKVDDY